MLTTGRSNGCTGFDFTVRSSLTDVLILVLGPGAVLRSNGPRMTIGAVEGCEPSIETCNPPGVVGMFPLELGYATSGSWHKRQIHTHACEVSQIATICEPSTILSAAKDFLARFPMTPVPGIRSIQLILQICSVVNLPTGPVLSGCQDSKNKQTPPFSRHMGIIYMRGTG